MWGQSLALQKQLELIDAEHAALMKLNQTSMAALRRKCWRRL